MNKITCFVSTAAIAAAFVAPASGQKLLLSEETHGFGFGYGDTRWDNFSAEIDSRFDQVDITPVLDNLSLMLEYDAVVVQLRPFTATLSTTEANNLADYIATGRKVMMFGENASFTTWSQSILNVVGGTFNGEGSGILTVANPDPILTNNVTALDMPTYCGVALGGTSLFTQNFATLWSGAGNDNVLTVL
ncbi:MAG: hypothetical protein ACOC0P_05940, partial [Planctomycetota bacterium]